MTLSTTEITGSFIDPTTGAPFSNVNVAFQVSQVLYIAGIPVVAPSAPVAAEVSGGQLLSASGGPLALLDEGNSVSLGTGTGFWWWQVSITGDITDSWSFQLPHSASAVDLWSTKNTGGSGGGGVTSFNGRTGAVVPASGDYTPAEVGAIATTAAGTANGVATLGASGLVPQAELAPVSLTTPVTSKYAPLLYGAIWGRAHQFYADSWRCKGDGKAITDGVMTTVSPTALACTSSSPFASGDVGKAILVSTAKGSFAHLATTIAGFTDSAHVTLAGSATANTGGTPGAITAYGTDDASNMQVMLNAADAYGRSHGYAEVLLDPTALYVTASPFQVGTSGNPGNYELGLPNVPQAGMHYQLALIGGADSAPLMNWAQLVPEVSGAVIACLRTDGTNDGTNGPAHVIGGPVAGYGGETGASTGWSNVHLLVRGLSTLSPYNATFGGMDLFAIASCNVESFSALTMGVVPSSAAPAPVITNPGNISNQWGWGLRLPSSGNNAAIDVGTVRTEGHCYGFGPSEHSVTRSARCIYSIIGLEAYAGGSSGDHAATVVKATVEGCGQAIGFFNGVIRVDYGVVDTESIQGAQVYDPFGNAQGYIGLRALNANADQSTWVNGGGALRIIDLLRTPGMITLPGSGTGAKPASGGAWTNYYYRDLEVTLSVSGGTISAVTSDSTAEIVPASCTWYRLTVPSGHSFTPTYTGTLSMTAKAS